MARITHFELTDIANVAGRMNGYETPDPDGNVWFGDGTCEVYDRNDELIGHLVRSRDDGWTFDPIGTTEQPISGEDS